MTEVILEDSDVSKVITEYINLQQIHNFVHGESTRHSLAKKFRPLDLAATIVKTAPEFCAMHVISKRKAIIVRSAKSPMLASPLIQAAGTVPRNHSDRDDPIKKTFLKGVRRASIPSPLPPDQMKPAPREKKPFRAKPQPGPLSSNNHDIDDKKLKTTAQQSCH